MRYILALLLTCYAALAQAVDLEIGAGMSRYTPRGNGMWYQEGLPHALILNAPAFEIGLTDNSWQRERYGLDWHVSYVYMGNVHTDAQATSLDANYDASTKRCISLCDRLARFVGNGHNQGVKFTLEPTFTYAGWRLGVEGGIYVFHPTWHAAVYNVAYCETCDAQTLHFATNIGLRAMPVVGFNVGNGEVSVAYMHYFNKTLNDPTYAFWRATDTITLRYRF